MSLRWFCTHFRRLPKVYGDWVAESHLALGESARLLNVAREDFDQARTVRSDDLPWCKRCGERLGRTISGPQDGTHGRCGPSV